MSLSLRRPNSTPWKPVALEIVEGLGKAVVLIVSTVAVVVFGIVLAAVVVAVIVPQTRMPASGGWAEEAASIATMATNNKCLAQSNKSDMRGKATKRRTREMNGYRTALRRSQQS